MEYNKFTVLIASGLSKTGHFFKKVAKIFGARILDDGNTD